MFKTDNKTRNYIKLTSFNAARQNTQQWARKLKMQA